MTNPALNPRTTGMVAARIAFRVRGNDSEIHLSEVTLAEIIDAAIELSRTNQAPAETSVDRPQLEWQVTYDVVAYNESWGGYGYNASKDGFQSAEEAITYAKPLEAHLNATVWQRTKPKSVVRPPSVKIWPVQDASPVEPSRDNESTCAICGEHANEHLAIPHQFMPGGQAQVKATEEQSNDK